MLLTYFIMVPFARRIPRPLRWILSVLISFLLLMSLYRLIFYFRYNPLSKPFSGSAFLMGLRFDIKFVCIAGVCMLVLCSIPFLDPFQKTYAKKLWYFLLPLLFAFMLAFYITDYFFYSYLQQRLNANIFSFAEDAAIASNMVWHTYPVIKIAIVAISLFAGACFLFSWLLNKFASIKISPIKKKWSWYVGFFFLFALGVFGKFSQFNLRWSDAFTLSDNFKANLSLNPLQSFFSSLRYRDTKPDINKVRQYYPLMASFLGVQKTDSNLLNFERKYTFDNPPASRPNVVIVICESFSMFRSTMGGNPFKTTPYFNELCKKGIFYDRCFTPSFPTARGVWATITGIPDVLGDNNRTASRNPELVDQNCIINSFTGYEKLYFIGGDPSWANIKGLLMNNIDSLKLFSQSSFKAPKKNVWGIDDRDLLLESNGVLAKQTRPFFAVIQTADNHKPYATPKDGETSFKNLYPSKDSLQKFGFEDEGELNAFRYSDYCFQLFFDAATKEKYFNNTIFIFVGDHGMPGNSDAMYPKSWNEFALTREHVPLLFYAPALIKPTTVHTVSSQLDILPSIASYLKIPYQSNAMGRDLFDTIRKREPFEFIIDHEAGTIGVVGSEYYFIKSIKTGKTNFVSVLNNDKVVMTPETEGIKKEMATLTDAYYETAKYLLFNNKREKMPAHTVKHDN